MQKVAKRTKFLAFLPALVAVGVTAFVASGASIISGATAASSVGVDGSVTNSITVNPGLGSGAANVNCTGESIGTSFAATFQPSDGCQLSFSSNGPNGAEVVFENTAANAGQAAFFCSDGITGAGGTRSCATNAGRLENASGTPGAIADGSDLFGIALRAVGGDGGTTTGTNMAAADATPTGPESIWVGIANTGTTRQLCRSTGPNTTGSTCDFVFGGSGSGGTQGSGDYSGTMDVTTRLL